jgi:hypothetical protein
MRLWCCPHKSENYEWTAANVTKPDQEWKTNNLIMKNEPIYLSRMMNEETLSLGPCVGIFATTSIRAEPPTYFEAPDNSLSRDRSTRFGYAPSGWPKVPFVAALLFLSTSATMASSLGSSTAVRVLPSTLASRAAPTVPSASQNYEPLVKSVLRHRLLFRIFAYTAGFSWVLVILASAFRKGSLRSLGLTGVLLHPILPQTLALTFVIWSLSALPIVVMRKMSLTGA